MAKHSRKSLNQEMIVLLKKRLQQENNLHAKDDVLAYLHQSKTEKKLDAQLGIYQIRIDRDHLFHLV